MQRSEAGLDFGVILIPEGLIDFVPEVRVRVRVRVRGARYFLWPPYSTQPQPYP